MKQNNVDNYEPIKVYLTPEITPIAYGNKVQCLKLSGLSEKEARKIALEPIELELYYEVAQGLFAVESEALESSVICSPYTGIDLEDDDTSGKEPEIKVVIPFGMSKLDCAYALKTKYENSIRNCLVDLINHHNGYMTIPEHNNGYFSLCMLDMGYNTFYFKDMTYDGNLLSFSGTNEDGENLDIDECDLPDNGLLYLFDYLDIIKQ